MVINQRPARRDRSVQRKARDLRAIDEKLADARGRAFHQTQRQIDQRDSRRPIEVDRTTANRIGGVGQVAMATAGALAPFTGGASVGIAGLVVGGLYLGDQLQAGIRQTATGELTDTVGASAMKSLLGDGTAGTVGGLLYDSIDGVPGSGRAISKLDEGFEAFLKSNPRGDPRNYRMTDKPRRLLGSLAHRLTWGQTQMIRRSFSSAFSSTQRALRTTCHLSSNPKSKPKMH